MFDFLKKKLKDWYWFPIRRFTKILKKLEKRYFCEEISEILENFCRKLSENYYEVVSRKFWDDFNNIFEKIL